MVISKESNNEYNDLDKLKEKNKKLKEKLKIQEEKNRKYKKALANKSLIERWKIGTYLHDDLAQQLASAKISVCILRDELSKENLSEICNEIINIIDESLREVRDLSHDIIPLDVEKEGVEKALNHLKRQVENQHNIKCRLQTDEILHKINSRKVATNLYHITQEAIKNAINHGKANNIKIVLIEHEQQLYLHVKDDGSGLDSKNGSGGMGITIMKHRAEVIGGSLRIKDAKEDGYSTCVTCTLPLESLEDQ
ncbi:hypothetical protein CK503_00430 [Aliifodinibius salipaludis]|uniref:Oxygen sensor histidine kinase NreB n=1 Tax=Fodinibius salipaludis TaxID=2032627 RepID=A0A2A2GF57_9BACT|nr:ATP-binding protein [Aliifodinibius salipaludis]PAU95567.1 hypothetical protein CK503_00430 [Aliifodinibius salipaludis]